MFKETRSNVCITPSVVGVHRCNNGRNIFTACLKTSLKRASIFAYELRWRIITGLEFYPLKYWREGTICSCVAVRLH